MNKKALYGGLGVGGLGILALVIILVMKLGNKEPESESSTHSNTGKDKDKVDNTPSSKNPLWNEREMGPGEWALDKIFDVELFLKFKNVDAFVETSSGYETLNSEAIFKAIKKNDFDQLYADLSLQKLQEVSGRILSLFSEDKNVAKMEVECNLMLQLFKKLVNDAYKGRIGREALEKKANTFYEVGCQARVYFGTIADILEKLDRIYCHLLADSDPNERNYLYEIKKHKYYPQFRSFLKEFRKMVDPKEIDIVNALSEISSKYNLDKERMAFITELEIKHIYLPRYLFSLPKVPKDDPHPAFKSALLPLINRVSVLFNNQRWKYLAGLFSQLKEKQEIAVFWIGLEERLKTASNMVVPDNVNTKIIAYLKTGKIPGSLDIIANKTLEGDSPLKPIIAQHLTLLNN